MSAETFQSFWYGSELSARERLCLTSFVSQGKNFDLYTYDGSLSVPEGVVLRDASEIYPEDEVFTYQSGRGEGSVAVFADFFRYKLLYERGGWWVDTDVFYTGAPVPDSEVYFGRQNPSRVAIGMLRFPKKSLVPKKCVERVKSIGKEKASKTWGETGPRLFTRILREENRMHEARPESYAYPIPWRDAKLSYLPGRRREVEEKLEGVPFFHLWNEILRRMGIQKDVRPPEGSYLDVRAQELDFNWPCSEVQYSAETVDQLEENWKDAQSGRHLNRVQSTLTWKVVSRLNSVLQGAKSSLEIWDDSAPSGSSELDSHARTTNAS